MSKPSIKDIHGKIYFFRGHRVMLDSDLAFLYRVETKALNQAVRRNIARFPDDFMFQLSAIEYEFLRSQNVTLETEGRGKHRKFRPLVFTELLEGEPAFSTTIKRSDETEGAVTIKGQKSSVAEFDMHRWYRLVEENEKITKNLDRKLTFSSSEWKEYFKTQEDFDKAFDYDENEKKEIWVHVAWHFPQNRFSCILPSKKRAIDSNPKHWICATPAIGP